MFKAGKVLLGFSLLHKRNGKLSHRRKNFEESETNFPGFGKNKQTKNMTLIFLYTNDTIAKVGKSHLMTPEF